MLDVGPSVRQMQVSGARPGGRPRRIALCVISICFVLGSGRSYAADFEVSCPGTLPPLSGHLPGLPAGWDLVTNVLPIDLLGIGVGDERGSDERPNHMERLPNGDFLKTWSFDRITFAPYVLCGYLRTQVQLAQKIPPDIKNCQSHYRSDRNLVKLETITCSR